MSLQRRSVRPRGVRTAGASSRAPHRLPVIDTNGAAARSPLEPIVATFPLSATPPDASPVDSAGVPEADHGEAVGLRRGARRPDRALLRSRSATPSGLQAGAAVPRQVDADANGGDRLVRPASAKDSSGRRFAGTRGDHAFSDDAENDVAAARDRSQTPSTPRNGDPDDEDDRDVGHGQSLVVQHLNERIEALSAELSEAISRIASLEADALDAGDEARRLRRDLGHREAELTAEREERREAERMAHEAEAEAVTLRDTIRRMRAAQGVGDERRDTELDRLRADAEVQHQAADDLREARAENSALAGRIRILEGRLLENSSLLAEAEDDRDSALDRAAEARGEVLRLGGVVSGLEIDAGEARLQLATLTDERSALERRLARAADEIADLERRLQEREREIISMSDRDSARPPAAAVRESARDAPPAVSVTTAALNSIRLTIASLETSLACSRCFDVMNDPVTFAVCGHQACRACVGDECEECGAEIAGAGLHDSDRLDAICAKYAMIMSELDHATKDQ